MNIRFNFTKAQLQALPPTATRITYHDIRTSGLQLRMTGAGTKTFSFVYRFHAIQQRVTLGKFPDIAIDQARRKVAELQARILAGENPAASKRHAEEAAVAELTLRDAFELYYKNHLQPEGKRTADALRQDFARYLGTVQPGQKKLRGREKKKSAGSVNWENRKLSAISTADVRRMMMSLKDEVGPRTANKMLVLLKAIYRKCTGWKLYAGIDPCADPDLKKFALGERSRSRYLQAEELPRFFAALAIMDADFQDFIKLSLFTGGRRENVMGMRWQDIQWDARSWIVPGEQSKTGELLSIPLISLALQILTNRYASCGQTTTFVFPAGSQSGYMTAPTRKWQTLLRKAGINDLRIHDLRRSMGSWMINTGASLAIVGESLGHRSTQATRVYARLQLSAVRDSMDLGVNTMLRKAGVAAHADPLAPKEKQ